ncbi:MAG: hypothetical protein IPG93_18180 [Burkholderiales bacterium]|nr:hypothetical protein [Burkholderiales bacterium]
MSILRLCVPWLVILLLAFANGALRELLLLPWLGYPWALLLSGLLLGACVVLVTWFSLAAMKLENAAQAFAAGVVWLALTLVFEFTFGRLVQGKSWGELLGAYTFARGNLWPLVLLVILLSPLAVHRLRAAGA